MDSLINSSSKVFEKIIKITERNNPEFAKNCSFIKGDIRDQNLLNNIFEKEISNKNKIEAVIHFSGLKSVHESFLNPLEYWDVNFCGTINLLKVIEKYSCNSFVFSSSATVYGVETTSPIKESAVIEPINPYGKTKAAVENILDDYSSSKSNEISIGCLRYFNPIGAHPSGFLGENPNGIPTNIFPLLNKVAFGELDQIKIFGNDWDTNDGTGVRDFIHVMDIADGHVGTLEYLLENKNTNIKLNLGTGKGTSVLELINIFKNVNHVEIPYIFDKRRVGDRDIVYADNSLAKKILKWEPKRTVEEMCLDGWNWQLKNPKGY